MWDADENSEFPLVYHQYPWRTCWQGDHEITGFRRPQSYFREAIWKENTEPKIFTTHPKNNGKTFRMTEWSWWDVCDTWTFDDSFIGKKVKTEVYSTADEIRFILNGREVGTAIPEKAIATIAIPYEKGELKAEAIKDGKVVGSSVLKTVGKPSAIKVTAEKSEISADGRDLCYFEINVTDENSNRIPDAENELSCEVCGGELISIFSGNPCNEDDYTSGKCHAFGGRAIAVVKTKEKGKITLIVNSEKLKSDKAEITAK